MDDTGIGAPKRPGAAEAQLRVRGLVRAARDFTLEELSRLSAAPSRCTSPEPAVPVRVSLVDLLSVVRVDRRAQLLVANDQQHRSVAIPLHRILDAAALVIRCDERHAPVALHAPGWTPGTSAFGVVELVAVTFDEFVGCPSIDLATCQHEAIDVTADALRALMSRVQAGDRGAFGDLYDAIAPQVFGVIKRVLRDPAMSEEVTQEVFLEIWSSAERFDPTRASVSTWAITIARRRAVDRVRREQSQRNRIAELQQQPTESATQPDAEVEASMDSQAVADALRQLPDDQREVIRLAFLDGHAHGAIAERLDLPLGTVKGRVRGGLKRLRVLLDVSVDEPAPATRSTGGEVIRDE